MNWGGTLLYYLLLLGVPAAGVYYGYSYQAGESCSDIECDISVYAKYLWFVTTPFLVASYLGLFLFPATIKERYEPIGELSRKFHDTLVFRIVTRGKTPDLVNANVKRIHNILTNIDLDIDWRIQVVTDSPTNTRVEDRRVSELVVPDAFQLDSGTKFKARALHYALISSDRFDRDWTLHLDEESCIDKRTVQGVLTHILKHNGDKAAIGQGVISYAPTDIQGCQHWIVTLADSLRVANDYGAFRLQYQLFNTAYIGMKGSFVLVRNDLAKDVGWDHGLEASITEDAFFAMLARDKGYQFGFIDACVYELSPFTIPDMWKQRRRWIDGLWKVCTSSQISCKGKGLLFVAMTLWTVSWLAMLTIALAIAFPSDVGRAFSIAYGVNMAFIVISYLVGFFMTKTPADWVHAVGFWGYLGLGLCQIIGIPLYSFLEGVAIIYWCFTSVGRLCGGGEAGFDIVNKNKASDSTYIHQTSGDDTTPYNPKPEEQL